MMASVESMKEGEASGEETQEPPSKSSTDNEKTEKELPPLSGTFPEESRNCFSRISFHFLAPLMVLGYKRPLRHDDLWDLPESERVAKLLENYSSTKAQLCAKAVAAKSAASNAADTGSPEQETADGTSENVSAADVEVQTGENEESVEPTIGQVLWKQFRPAILLSGFFMLLQVACQVGGPLLIQQIVLATESTDTSDPYRGLYLAFIYFAVQFLNAIFQQQHLHRITRVGQRIRAVLMALIYRQSLELRQIDLASSKQANAVNLMSNDAQKFFDIMLTLHMVWAAPLQIVVAAIFLIILLGWPAIVGIVIIVLLVPINTVIARCGAAIRRKHMGITDKRVRLNSEMLGGMRIIKMFSWEQPFIKMVLNMRQKEMHFVFKELGIFASFIATLIVMPVISVVATFCVYVAAGTPLSADTAFASMAFFIVLRFPLMQFGDVINGILQAKVALDRIQSFMSIKKKITAVREPLDNSLANSDETPGASIVVDHTDFSWEAQRASNSQESKPNTSASQSAEPKKDGGESKSEGLEMVDVAGSEEPEYRPMEKFVLSQVDIKLEGASLTAICGAVGAGKSTLLESILGETNVAAGKHSIIRGSIAYVAQEAWILNTTVRENITFGKEFDAEWYQQCIEASCLAADIEMMTDGDETMIGEKGVTLSGGQKQRVSLARAAYARPDIILLDDPLSALDVHTGKKVFQRLLGPQGILKSSMRLLVTHAVQFLGDCTSVIVLYNGKSVFHGHYDELKDYSAKYTQNLANESGAANGNSANIAALLESLTNSAQEQSEDAVAAAKKRALSESEEQAKKTDLAVDDSAVIGHAEGVGSGGVGLRTTCYWVACCGGFLLLGPYFFFLVVERTAYIFNDWWLATWTSATSGELTEVSELYNSPFVNMTGVVQVWVNSTPTEQPPPAPSSFDLYYIHGYLAIMGLVVVLVACRIFTLAWSGGLGSRRIYEKLLTGIVYTPMMFFETTPLGRIVNRLSYDTEIIDFLIIRLHNSAFASVMWLLSSVVVMAYVVPYILIVLAVVAMVYIFMVLQYRRSCVQLQRLDAVSRSPIQAKFSETLTGVATIRAFEAQPHFTVACDQAIDSNTQVVHHLITVQRWLGYRLETLGAIVVFFVAFLIFFFKDSITGGLAGIAVMWASNFTVSMNFNVVFTTNLEANLTSLERIMEYSSLPSEDERLRDKADVDAVSARGCCCCSCPWPKCAKPKMPKKSYKQLVVPPENWPSAGQLSFKSVVLRYRPGLPPALRGLTFEVNAGDNVGVVGRTGAGKSTIAVAMLRLVELESGSISIDGVALGDVGLPDVRGRAVCIIPQDPILFSGTIRSNLDPFEERGDHEVMDALKRIRMDHLLDGDGLNAEVQAGGSNFSAGERQLLCLARAMLRVPKVLVLDEATASVDPETDAFLTDMISRLFADVTTITIAHRLQTIMQADKILVMDKGVVAEEGTPAELLSKDDGIFTGMVNSTGDESKQALIAMVRAQQQEPAAADSKSDE